MEKFLAFLAESWIALASLVVAMGKFLAKNWIALGTLIGMWFIYFLERGERAKRATREAESISKELETTNISSKSIEKEQKISDEDKKKATDVARKLDKIDKRFNKPMGDPSNYVRLGNAEYNEKNYERAREYYDKALKLKQDYAEAWVSKGKALDELGHYKKALKAYDKAIKLKSDFAWAWYDKGITLRKLGRYEEALKAFDEAIELKSDFAWAWGNKACIYSLKGDKENARQNLSKAIKLDPKCKEDAKKDKDFKDLWDDEDFKIITR